MRLNTFPRRPSRPAPCCRPARPAYRPVVEQLETRLVPSGIFPPGTAPTITSLSANSAVEGQPGFLLTVNGMNFNNTSIVLFNGSNLATTFVSPTQLQAIVPAGALAEESAGHGGPANIAVFEFANGGAGVGASVPFTVQEAPLLASGVTPFTTAPGQAFTNVAVATFKDTGGPEATGDYAATINWGDTTTSTGTVVGPDLNGLFTVLGSHTYNNGGIFPITVTITHETAPAVMVTDTANIIGPMNGNGGFTIVGAETTPIVNAPVATFTGGTGSASSCTATINWGDGTTSTGTISGPDSNSVFTVTGSHTYAEDGENEADFIDKFTVTTTINCMNMASVTVTSTANIAEEMTPAGGVTVMGFETVPLTNVVVAQFSGGLMSTAGCTVTINWGDQTTSTGTLSGPDVNGIFTVTGSHTYIEDGENEADAIDVFPVTTTINCPNMAPLVVTSSANIAEEGVVATGGPTITGIETVPITTVVAAFAGVPAGTNCTATINWGDNTTSVGVIVGPDANGIFVVVGNHTYVEDGEVEADLIDQFPVTTTINCPGMAPTTVTTTANIGEESIMPVAGPTINGMETVPITAVVAAFTGVPPGTNCTATINWGDNTTSAGVIVGPDANGVFVVVGNHTYVEDGEVEADLIDQFPVTTTINCPGMPTQTVTTTANIAEEAITPAGGPAINGIETVPITAVTASFIGAPPGSNCTATIDWGDGTTSAGLVVGPDMNGVSLVVGNHTYIEDGENEADAVDQFTVKTTINCPGMAPASTTTTAFIGEETITPSTGVVVTGRETFPLTNVVVASFNGGITSTNGCTATIDWGDGTTSIGTLSGPNQGIFTVTGSHTYVEDGEVENDLVDAFPLKITINCPGMAPTVITSTANIAEEDAPAGPAMTVTGMGVFATQLKNQDQTTAMITDADPNCKPKDFTATIYWGDGSSTTVAKVTQQGGPGHPFYVDATHTYKNVGAFHVYTLVGDSQGHYMIGQAMATVTPKGGGAELPGGSNAPTQPDDTQLVATALLPGTTGSQTVVGATLPASPGTGGAATVPSVVPTHTSSAQPVSQPSLPVDDRYGRIVALLLQGNQTSLHPNAWAADNLALALGTTAV